MTLFLGEDQVASLLEMGEVVSAVEGAFREVGLGHGVNFMRTRSTAGGSVLNVMHASLPHLGRAGLKSYMSTPQGTKFLVTIFSINDATPLAVMAADMLGRFRTGAASAVATKHLYRRPSARLAIFGSGRQAVTQVQAIGSVISIEEVRVWSPKRAHREDFAARLEGMGLRVVRADSPSGAAEGSEVGSTITSSVTPFLGADEVAHFAHLNICGSNHPRHSEITPEAVGSFEKVCLDDLSQARVEYGDLIAASSSGTFAWDTAVELSAVVAGRSSTQGRTLFKSGGVAIEDVAVASMIYDKAIREGIADQGSFEFS